MLLTRKPSFGVLEFRAKFHGELKGTGHLVVIVKIPLLGGQGLQRVSRLKMTGTCRSVERRSDTNWCNEDVRPSINGDGHDGD